MSNESKGLHFDHINKEGIDINKSCFIQLEGYIGEDYAAVLYKAHDISCKLNINVSVDLNNIAVTVKPDSDIETIVDKIIGIASCK